MKLGSLFDGSGGFPLAGTLHGIEPVWASEIEPYPLKVTAKRFPCMKQLGDVTKINGAEIEPVDIITFGSPCQDLSVAGKQLGIHQGERSNLFFEAIRIIKEMRENDRSTGRAAEHVRPRFAVWENVPGAFSSNKGRDFQAVLQALCEVADPDATVPFPEKGKWSKAGCIVGDGYSLAWRVYDAQYWGVPQRRKRIYLVADFASECAGEILFEQESMRGHSETGGEAREGTAEDVGGSAGRGCFAWTYRGRDGACNVEIQEDVGYCLREPGGGGSQPNIVYALQGNGIDRADTAGCNGCGWRIGGVHPQHDRPACSGVQGEICVVSSVGGKAEMYKATNLSPCLRSVDYKSAPVLSYVYDCRGNGAGGVSPTMTGDHQNRVTDYTAVPCAMDVLGRIARAVKGEDEDDT